MLYGTRAYDAFPHIFNVTNKSFLSDFGKWETDYLKKLNWEKNGPKAKLPDDQGWEYSFLWKNYYSKDYSVEPTTSLAHCKVDQLSFLQDPLDPMKSHVCKIFDTCIRGPELRVDHAPQRPMERVGVQVLAVAARRAPGRRVGAERLGHVASPTVSTRVETVERVVVGSADVGVQKYGISAQPAHL